MKPLLLLSFVFSISFYFSNPSAYAKQNDAVASEYLPSPSTENQAQKTHKDIQATFGFVPDFLKSYPEAGIAGAWMEMKSLQLNPNTELSGKSKELIGLAVAAQIPCSYCVYFHSAAAKANGAMSQEMKEAVAIAGLTRHWSTWLNGNGFEFAAFKKEVDKMIEITREKMRNADPASSSSSARIDVVDGPSALKDMEQTLGFVPTFMKSFPPGALAGAWRAMKELEFNPMTALSGKDKELIGIAVAAQIPCDYCLYSHRQSALLEGASESEIREAIAMASVTRHWSTVLNGLLIDEKKFKRETDRILSPNKQKIAQAK